jgi:hypothetical protein
MNPSERIDQLIAGLTDWRGKTLASVRKSVLEADKLFNAGLGGNAWRAIDFFEGDKINERALKNLVRAAVDYNQIKLKRKAPAGRAKVHKSKK